MGCLVIFTVEYLWVVSLARHNLVAAVGCLVIFTVEYLWVG